MFPFCIDLLKKAIAILSLTVVAGFKEHKQ